MEPEDRENKVGGKRDQTQNIPESGLGESDKSTNSNSDSESDFEDP